MITLSTVYVVTTMVTTLYISSFGIRNNHGPEAPTNRTTTTGSLTERPHYEAAQDHGAANGRDAKTSAPAIATRHSVG